MKKILQHKTQLDAGRSAIIYALFGLIWILFSDQAVFILFKNSEQWYLAQNLKGFFYILVTTVLVYILIKKSISTIRQQEATVHLLANNTKDVIWSLNMSRQITYINPAIENIVGIKQDELIGENVERICTEKTIAQIQEYLSRELQKGPGSTGLVFTAELLHKDGLAIPVEISGRIIYNENNQPFSIQGVSRDIRERYAMQAQLRQAQKMESIGTMASGIAHEVNNPIASISACAELLLRKPSTSSEDKKLLNTISEQSFQIHQIIANLLGFVRVEENPEPSMVSPKVPLEKCIELVSTTLRHEHIKLKIDIENGLPEILCYPHQIQQILLNLIDNAKDALNDKFEKPSDQKILEVSVSNTGRDAIRYKIVDYGQGMSFEQLEKIFDPFYTTKPEGKGTGLGMWIIHQILKNHNGSVIVESHECHYTQIEIELPFDFRTCMNNRPPTVQINNPDKRICADSLL